jgi:hypothetical protein
VADSSFTWDDSELQGNLRQIDRRILKGMAATAGYIAPQAEGWMRSNAPWTDRTGNARNGLRGTPKIGGMTVSIVLSHSVPYGIWLETRWGGAYAIIGPAIQHWGPETMRMLGRTLGGR